MCEILRKIELIALSLVLQGRLMTLVPSENACATSFYSLIVTFDVSRTIFEIFTTKARKWLVFFAITLFDASAQGRAR